MDAIEISKYLKRRYLLQLIPAVILMGLLYLFGDQLRWQGATPGHGNLINDILVALAAAIGIAFPVFFRSYFVFKIRHKKGISEAIFIRFEKIQMTFALITPYFLVFSIAFDKTNKANIFITILALYAAYYYFPSVRKVKFEMKIFRIKASEPNIES
jgi:hypothetical protein